MARQFVCVFCKPPDQVTEAGHRFFEHHKENLGYVRFVELLAKRADEFGRLAAEMAAITNPTRGADESGALKALASFRRLELELQLSRATDNFLTYLSELLGSIFVLRPETMKSSETVRLDEVLQHKTMDEIVRALAARKVERLSYQGMKAFADELQTKMGFQLFGCEHDLARAVRIVESRNLIAHNRGLVNDTFRSRTGLNYRIGNYLPLQPKSVSDDLDLIAAFVFDIDKRAASKWGLPSQSFTVKCEHWEQYLPGNATMKKTESAAAPVTRTQ
jgi:hypothetical protein